MLRRSADFPHSLIGAAPDGFEVLEQGTLKRPVRLPGLQPALPRLMECVHHLAEDVELQLLVRRISDTHRP